MTRLKWTILAMGLAVTAGALSVSLAAEDGKSNGRRRTASAWTLAEVQEQLALNPGDPYLQYVAMQLARRESKTDDAEQAVNFQFQSAVARNGRGQRADVFSLFTGALAVQESLQLDSMRGAPVRPAERKVSVADLAGPTIKSHPWEQMLAGREPKVSQLARWVPADQYLVQCRSLTKLLELLDVGDLWASHLFNQATQDATTSRMGERIREQLAVRSDPLSRPFYDLVVDEVAITGSDLYLREGSDVTVLFRLKQPEVFKTRMDAFLTEAQEKHPAAKRTSGEFQGVRYVQVSTPDRQVHVFSAYPEANVHVRSNSLPALQRVLGTMQGTASGGAAALGHTAEFKYIRTLMPEGAAEEDAFVYLSDPFIRQLVGPKLKLTERRRLLDYNHLRMIGHAAMMFRTEFGRSPKSLAELAEAKCAPALFGDGQFKSPTGGQYSLAADGMSGFCNVSGGAQLLIPCDEIPLKDVTDAEAAEYQAFLEQYNQYWRTYFDPIAVRVQIRPKRYRVETIVLPLIDNSIYTGLASILGGEPEPLDSLPVPKGNIFSIVARVNKQVLLEQGRPLGLLPRRALGAPDEGGLPHAEEFLLKGLGNQVGLHVYDSTQLFDFNLPGFMGMMAGTFNGSGRMSREVLPISVLIASLNSPVYVALPVKDATIVDNFLDELDGLLVARARQLPVGFFFDVSTDFYQVETSKNGRKVRALALSLGPLKWRFFWSRIGDGLYIASKKFIIDDLAALGEAPAKSAEPQKRTVQETGASFNPTAHAMVRIRAQHWDQVLPDYQLGWAENDRRACLNNLGRLSNVARACASENPQAAKRDPAKAAVGVVRQASILYGVYFDSPGGGEYRLTRDGKRVEHSVYGSLLAPRQPAALNPKGKSAQVLRELAGATAELEFLPDGLHAVLTIEKK